MGESITERSIYGSPKRIESGTNDLVTTMYYDVLGREIRQENNVANGATGAWSETLYEPCNAANCPTGAVYVVTKSAADGSSSKVYFDKLARIMRSASLTFKGDKYSCVDNEHDKFGRVVRVSNPFYCDSAAAYWTVNTYDLMGKMLKTTAMHQTGPVTQTYTHNGYTNTMINPKGHVKTEVKNGLGELVQVTDHLGGRITYEYDSHNNLWKVHTHATAADVADGLPATTTVTLTYDDYNRKTAMQDPDKGNWLYRYNAFGELIWQKDGKGQVVQQSYDSLGRMERRTDFTSTGSVEQHTRWYYGDTTDVTDVNTTVDYAGPGISAVVMTTSMTSETCSASDSIQCNYPTYDRFGRAEAATTVYRIDGTLESYTTRLEYDDLGRTKKQFDVLDQEQGIGLLDSDGAIEGITSGTENIFNSYGFLQTVTDLQTDTALYTLVETNARGQAVEIVKGNGVKSTFDYFEESGQIRNQTGDVVNFFAIQQIDYTWDEVGNLTSRINSSQNSTNNGEALEESFCYDGLNRLVKTHRATTESCSGLLLADQDIRYDSRGNIRYKDGGEYQYKGTQPHAVSYAGDTSYYYDANGNVEYDVNSSNKRRSFTYSTFDKPTIITKQYNDSGQHTTEFAYGIDRSRYWRQDTDKDGVITTTRYLGGVERITKSNEPSKIEWKRYLGKSAIFTLTTDVNHVITNRKDRYIYRDHLGSLDVITDGESMVQQRLSFNAWGERRNTQDWTVEDIDALLDTSVFQTLKDETTRGFTGHEMVDEVGIIHMNGRIYDAKLARFLQADPFIQAATNTQSYNRYSYTFNNPLNATDPSGYISGSLKKSIRKYAGAIASVAIIAACYGTCTAQVLGAWLATAAAINAKFNGASGSQIFASAVLAFAGGAVGASGGEGAIYMSGVVGGVNALMNGGNFGNSFVTSLASSYLGGKVGDSKSSLVRIGGASIIGGTASKVTGGKFVSGAATSAFNAALVDKKVEANQQVAIEKDKLIREFANKIACEGNCGEAIASALKAASAQKGFGSGSGVGGPLTDEQKLALDADLSKLNDRIKKLDSFESKVKGLEWIEKNVYPLSVDHGVELGVNLFKDIGYRLDGVVTDYSRNSISNSTLFNGISKGNLALSWHSHPGSNSLGVSSDDRMQAQHLRGSYRNFKNVQFGVTYRNDGGVFSELY